MLDSDNQYNKRRTPYWIYFLLAAALITALSSPSSSTGLANYLAYWIDNATLNYTNLTVQGIGTWYFETAPYNNTTSTVSLYVTPATVFSDGYMTAVQATALSGKALGSSCVGDNGTVINVTMNATTGGVQCVEVLKPGALPSVVGNVTGNGLNGTSGYHVYQTSNTALKTSNLSENQYLLYYPNSLLIDGGTLLVNATANNISANGNFIVNNIVEDPTNINYFEPQTTEFCDKATTTGFYGPFKSEAVNSGTLGTQVGNKTHPCVLTILDSTTALGGGYIGTDQGAIGINGTENATLMLKMIASGSALKPQETLARFGFLDIITGAAISDGCYIEFNTTGTNSAKGVCTNNGANANTSSSYAYLNNTWYIANIYINPTSNNATFKIYNESGTLLWNDSLDGTRIPTLIGRETGFGFIATQNTTDAGNVIAALDFMKLTISRPLRNVVFTG